MRTDEAHFAISDEPGFGRAIIQFLTNLHALFYPHSDQAYERIHFSTTVHEEQHMGCILALQTSFTGLGTHGAIVYVEVWGLSLRNGRVVGNPNDWVVFEVEIIDEVMGDDGGIATKWNGNAHSSAEYD